MMTGQGFLFKVFSAFGSYRSSLTNRAATVSYQQTAGVSKKTQQKIDEMNLPERPKKPMLPYFRYLSERRIELIKQNPELKLVALAKQCGEEWKSVTEENKARYKELYEKEMVEYIKKHLDYLGKLTEEQKALLKDAKNETTNRRKLRKLRKMNKDSERPKRVRCPFSFYLKEVSERIEKPTGRNLINTVMAEWKKLSSEEKQKYYDLCEDDKKRYQLEMEPWEKKMIKDGNLNLVRQSTLIEIKPELLQKKKKKKKSSKKPGK